MPEYKLNYFNLRVLGEPIRWIFLVSGTPWEDNRLPFEQWGELKGKTGWGQVPVLEVDGQQMTQSQAICQFLAQRFKLAGDSDWEAGKCQELATHTQECRAKWAVHYHETDLTKRKAIVEDLKANVFPGYLEKFNKVVEKNGGNYLVGKRLSWADLFLVNFLQIWCDSIDANLLSKYPALKKLQENVMAVPAIKDWVDTRPASSYNGVTM